MSTIVETGVESMNRVICDFMGYVHSGSKDMDEWEMKNLKYHSSWDALMPAVEKISKLPLLNVNNTPCDHYNDTCYPITFNMPTDNGKVMFRFKGFSLHEAEKLIDAVHAAVFEVAEYHNSQTNNQQP